MLVPARGFTSSVSTALGATVMQVSRPIPAGSVVTGVSVFLRFGGTSVISWRAVLSASNQANEAALRAGVPVVDAAQTRFLGLPAIVLTGAAGELHAFDLFPGLLVSAGPSFLIVSISNVAAVAVSVVSAFEVMADVRDAPQAVPGVPGQ